MKKLDLKLICWAMLAALSAYSAFLSGYSFLLFGFMILTLLSMFIVCLAAIPVIRVLTAVLVMLGGFLASGTASVPFALLLLILPAVIMSFVIRRTGDFSITLCSGAGIFCLGIIVIDKLFVQPGIGGIRYVFSSAVDKIEENWNLVFSQLSLQSGVDVSDTLELLGGYFYSIKLLLPAIIIILALALMFFVLLFSRKVILNIPIPPFFMLHVPRFVAYVYFAGYIISAVTASSDVTGMVITNVIAVLSSVLMFSGLALIRFFTRKISSRLISMGVFIIAVPISLYIPGLLITFGTLDAVINFRRMVK